MTDAPTTTLQVRLDTRAGSPTHTVAAEWTDPHAGACYRAACGKVLAKADGAMLTTRETTCSRCTSGNQQAVPGPKPAGAS